MSINNDYKQYKNQLRQEFLYRCVYCETAEPELGGAKSFHIDHYKPKNKFPRLIGVYKNLLYACRDCNQYKGHYWPNLAEKLAGSIVLNPRLPQHQAEHHINKSTFAWQGKTAQGRWNVKKFRLDSEFRIKKRQDKKNIEDIINQLEKIKHENQLILFQLCLDSKNDEKISVLQAEVDDLASKIDTLKRQIIGSME